MNNFEKYKQIKSQFDFVYEGVHFNRVLAVRIWSIGNNISRLSLKAYSLFLLAIDISKINLPRGEQNILSTFGRYYKRNDHLELYKNVLSKLDGKASYNNTLDWNYKLTFHPKIIFKVYKFIRKNLSGTFLSFKQKLELAILTVHYCNILEEIKKINLDKVEKYLCQCSVLDLENLFTQYMKLRGIPTYSLQEGMYFIFRKNPPIDSVQYENFETDNLLCWGQYSIDEDYSYGIPIENLKLAGYPKKVVLYPLKTDNKYHKCMVLLARDSYRKTNNLLLNILASLSSEYDFCLKLHPSCDYNFYSIFASSNNMSIISKEKTINECLNIDEYDFCIAVNTTAYYESLMRGLPCLRFFDNSFDLMAGCDYDVFTTKEELDNNLNIIKNKLLADYQNDIDTTLKYAMGVGIDNYRKILCGY